MMTRAPNAPSPPPARELRDRQGRVLGTVVWNGELERAGRVATLSSEYIDRSVPIEWARTSADEAY